MKASVALDGPDAGQCKDDASPAAMLVPIAIVVFLVLVFDRGLPPLPWIMVAGLAAVFVWWLIGWKLALFAGARLLRRLHGPSGRSPGDGLGSQPKAETRPGLLIARMERP